MTLRAVLLGALLSVLICIWVPYSEFILHSSSLVTKNLDMGAILPFFFVLVVVNVLLKLLGRKFGLSQSELVIIFCMCLVSVAIPTFSLAGYLIAYLSKPHYFASPENQWGEYITKHLPSWFVPTNDNHAMEWLYIGLPKGKSIPWGTWFVPLFWWLSFIIVFFFVFYCIAAILRKQWVENERVRFPITEPIVEMTKKSRSVLPAFMHNRLFWIGFGLSAFAILWNIGSYFHPLLPVIPIESRRIISFGRDFPGIFLKMNIPVFSFAFFANLDVLASIWFFHLIGVIQIGVFRRIGFSIGPRELESSLAPSVGYQSYGALVFMVLWGLWVGRRHLKNVFKKAFSKNSGIDDSGELLSYRTAVFGLILGLTYVSGWLHKAGMGYPAVFVFVLSILILYIGVGRLMAKGGLIFARGPLMPGNFTCHALGTFHLSAPSLAVLSLSRAFLGQGRTLGFFAFSHIGKLSDVVKNRRGILLAVFTALAVSLTVSIYYTLFLCYHNGAQSFGYWMFSYGSNISIDTAIEWMKGPFGPALKRFLFLGIGATVAAGLTFLRYRFLWWPLHPIGFIISTIDPIRWTVFPIFLAWATKFLLLKLGGIEKYKGARLLVIGLAMGYFVGAGISFLVDMFCFPPGQGHPIVGW